MYFYQIHVHNLYHRNVHLDWQLSDLKTEIFSVMPVCVLVFLAVPIIAHNDWPMVKVDDTEHNKGRQYLTLYVASDQKSSV